MKKHLPFFIFLSTFFAVQCFSQNHPPAAVNDTAWAFRGHASIDVLNNDFDSDGNTIRIISFAMFPKHGLISFHNDSIIEYTAFPSFSGGFDSLYYCIREINGNYLMDTALLYLKVSNSLTFDSLNINNVKAGINADGFLFNEENTNLFQSYYEVPAGSGKTSIFSGHIWVGAYDSIDTLHIAAPMYVVDTLNDYWAGPVSNVYDSFYDYKFKRLWKIKKTDIDYHMSHCWDPGYIPSASLIDWPGNGDNALGQAAILAPFKDWNNDGIYDPFAGDYPLIKGDEAVYFIFNDDRSVHSLSKGEKLKIEIHGMAYAYNCPNDSALWNSIFINYKIYNRSQNTYYNCLIGMNIDFDLGNANDDYMGCDVQRGSFYCYNGDNFDGTNNPQDYGAFPPAQALTVLAGPKMDPDGIDNPSGMCNNSVNGFNFDNGIIDDERYGLSKFVYFYYPSDSMGNPVPFYKPNSFYYNLEGRWSNDSVIEWGGAGYPGGPGVCGPVCSFMYPGDSDSCHWGTNGLVPYCTPYWTEKTVGNQPSDRRGLGSCGPFTFEPGSEQELDIAYVFGRNYVDSNAWAGVQIMQQRIDSIRKYFVNDSTPCGLSFSGIVPSPIVIPQIKIFPNPAVGYITVDATGMLCDLNYVIYDILGREISQGTLKCTSANQIYIAGLQNGMYIINVSDGKKKISRKFIKQ